MNEDDTFRILRRLPLNEAEKVWDEMEGRGIMPEKEGKDEFYNRTGYKLNEFWKEIAKRYYKKNKNPTNE